MLKSQHFVEKCVGMWYNLLREIAIGGVSMKKIMTTVLFAALLVSCADEPLTNNPPVVREKPAAVTEAEQGQAETVEPDEAQEEVSPKKGKLKPAEQTELFYTYQSRLCAGDNYLIGAKDDGTVLISAGEGVPAEFTAEVSGWTDITALCAADSFAAGLRSDGTVVYAAFNGISDERITALTDVAAIAADDSTFGALRSDGTVVFITDGSGDWTDVSGWSDIVRIDVGDKCIAGVKADGTVVIASEPDEEHPLDFADGLKNVSDAAFGDDGALYTLRKNGTISRDTAKLNDERAVGISVSNETPAWTDVNCNAHFGEYFYDRGTAAAIVSSGDNAFILKSDGTVAAVRKPDDDTFRGWQDWKLFEREIAEFAVPGEDTAQPPADMPAEEETAEEDTVTGCHITADEKYTAINSDGTILCFDEYGRYHNIKGFRDPVSISECDTYLYVTMKDGKIGVYDLFFDKRLALENEVLGAGEDKKLLENVRKFDYGAVLYKDGTVRCAGLSEKIGLIFEEAAEWENIEDIAFYENLLFGITSDGRVKSSCVDSSPYLSVKAETEGWTDIAKVGYSKNNAVFGLHKGGTVSAADISGENAELISLLAAVTDAKDIAVTYGERPSVYVLSTDGTVHWYAYTDDTAAEEIIAEDITEINIMGGRRRNDIVMMNADGELLSTAERFALDDPFTVK